MSDPLKDAIRIQQNEKALIAARQGDQNAIAYLLFRTGRYGELTIEGYGNIRGWGSEIAKRDAWEKVQEVILL